VTARDLISDVLQDIGKLGVGDYLDDADAESVRRSLNTWIDALALESLLIFHLLRTPHTLTANTATYTIGTGGVINIPRPVKIERAGLIHNTGATPPYEAPIDVFTEQRWQMIPQKDLGGPLAQGIYFDKGWTAGLGLITPWPKPTAAGTALVLYTEQAFTAFADLDTVYTFPPGYELFFRTNLAGEICDGFGKTLSAKQEQRAVRARAMVKRANIKIVESVIAQRVLDLNGRTGGRPYNIWTDE
jgi:hypothetical protein